CGPTPREDFSRRSRLGECRFSALPGPTWSQQATTPGLGGGGRDHPGYGLFDCTGVEQSSRLQSRLDASHDTGAHPLLKAAMARRVGRITRRKISPSRACAQDEQYAVERLTPAAPRAATAVLPPLRFGDQGIQARPLCVSQVSSQRTHTSCSKLK